MTTKPEIAEGVNDTCPDEEGVIYQPPDCNCTYIYDEGTREWLRCSEHIEEEVEDEPS